MENSQKIAIVAKFSAKRHKNQLELYERATKLHAVVRISARLLLVLFPPNR